MTESTFDPEVARLLGKIASDPSSTLLKFPERPLKHWLAGPEEQLTPHASHLTRVEKHVVGAYREEAAWVLLKAAIAATRRGLLVFSSLDEGPEQIREEAKALQRALPGDAGVEGQLESVLRASAAGSELARGAMRLHPSDFGRLCLGLALIAEGEPTSAVRALAPLLDNRTCFKVRAQAHEARAHVHAQETHYVGALECSEQALAADEGEDRFLVWCLTTSIQGNRVDRAREFVHRIDCIRGSTSISQIATALLAERRAGTWKPSQHARSVMADLLDVSEHRSREVLRVFA